MTTQMTEQQRRNHNNGEKYRLVAYVFAGLLLCGASRIILSAAAGLDISTGALVAMFAAVALLPVMFLAAAQDMPRWFNPVVVVLVLASITPHALWAYTVATSHSFI